MVKVKICGITSAGDASSALHLGADYLGVILYPKSPRFVPEEKREEILKSIKGAKSVAVMVNPSIEEVERAFSAGFDLIQLHGDEDIEFVRDVDMDRVIKAFRVSDTLPYISDDWKDCYAVLLDTYSKESYGGTGKTFRWELAQELVERGFRLFLSGGLSPHNVREAVLQVRPYAVDVSSGVELRPGVKDRAKVGSFIKEAKTQ